MLSASWSYVHKRDSEHLLVYAKRGDGAVGAIWRSGGVGALTSPPGEWISTTTFFWLLWSSVAVCVTTRFIIVSFTSPCNNMRMYGARSCKDDTVLGVTTGTWTAGDTLILLTRWAGRRKSSARRKARWVRTHTSDILRVPASYTPASFFVFPATRSSHSSNSKSAAWACALPRSAVPRVRRAHIGRVYDTLSSN